MADLNLMAIFARVVEAGSFSEAARRMGSSRSAISKAVAKLEKALPEMVNGCTPRAIREHLGLNKPIYARTAAYGHFGRKPEKDGGFSWEKTDLVDQLKSFLG